MAVKRPGAIPATQSRAKPGTEEKWRLRLGLVALVALVWRLPSFFDPPWVNDEGTYFAVAQSLAHGVRLYQGIWENKPPGIYLLYGIVYHLFGPSLLAIRALVALIAVALVALTFSLVRHFASVGLGLLSALLVGMLLGVPFLEGTTGNAELFVALLAAAAFYCVIVQKLPIAAGVLMAFAILFKSVGVFDAAALGILLMGWNQRQFIRYAGALAVSVGVWLAAAAGTGVLQPMLQDAVFYDLRYVGHANGREIPWLLLAKGVLLVALSLKLRKGHFSYLWLLFATAGALLSGRFFGHYALQMMVPMSVVLGHLLVGRRPLVPFKLTLLLPLTFVLGAAASAVVGWSTAHAGHDSILARRLQWYANFVRFAVGSEPRSTYDDQVDDHVRRNVRVAETLTRLPSGPLLVWGNTPWIYVLAHRLPATVYTSSLRVPEVPGETASLREALARRKPTVVVVISPPVPPLGGAAKHLAAGYRIKKNVENATVYVRAGSAAAVVSRNTTASASSGIK